MHKLTDNKDKKINKGFTLAELLATITILAIIALIIFPTVNVTINNSKEKTYNQQKENILKSAENWVLENTTKISKNRENYITISQLKQDGFLENKKTLNPITEEEMNGCIIISYDASHRQYTYEYTETHCSEL